MRGGATRPRTGEDPDKVASVRADAIAKVGRDFPCVATAAERALTENT